MWLVYIGDRKPMPEVSVILPTFNRAKFLAASIASVLSQTFTDWELIIADDGSDEETRTFLRGISHPATRLIELAHCGNPGRVRNVAIAAATGRYVAFQDSDDIWNPRKLEAQLGALTAQAAARWSYTACDRIDSDGALLPGTQSCTTGTHDGRVFEKLLRLETSAAMPTLMAERSLIEALGGFDEGLRFGEFHDLCLRLALASPVVVIDKPLSSVRAHQEHYSADRVAALGCWMSLYEKYARIAPDARLRAQSSKMRARTAARLAASHVQLGKPSAALATLRDSLRFSWPYPGWWGEAAKILVRSGAGIFRRAR
jgi:glycosyltransferase involved in cell wall biosynthesis